MGFEDDLAPEEHDFLVLFTSRFSAGPLFSPLICTPDECQIRRVCPFLKMGRRPTEGSPCAWEQIFAEERFRILCEQEGVTDMESIDASIIREYVNWEIMEQRLHGEYSNNPQAVERVFRGVDPHGEAIYDVKANPVFRNIEKTSGRKSQLKREMMATKLEKARHGGPSESIDASQLAAELVQKLEEVQRKQLEKSNLTSKRIAKSEEVVDAEFEVKEDE